MASGLNVWAVIELQLQVWFSLQMRRELLVTPSVTALRDDVVARLEPSADIA